MRFPDSFLFGASTSSFQIEGANEIDGRGASIWDLFANTPGKTHNGDTGDPACDHYRRYGEDLALMSELGLDAYRFSVAWSRIQPQGRGAVEIRGLDFYDRLVDLLLEREIEPWLCLYHWDLPQTLQDEGGWPSRDLVWRYVDYALLVSRRLGDRVEHWAMFNEPGIHAVMGHLRGWHAPGLRDLGATLAAGHHQNLATAEGARALRGERPGLEVGTILSFNRVEPVSDSGSDLDAATTAHAFLHEAYLEPLLDGSYPEPIREAFDDVVEEGDDRRLRTDLDWLGINYYTRSYAEAKRGAAMLGASLRPQRGSGRTGSESSEMGWEIYPRGLFDTLIEVSERAPEMPLYVTENGIATADRPDDDDQVSDERRIDFLSRHLEACLQAIERGIDLRGYFVWSLLDNFEWAEGYAKRFGLIFVDFNTQRRIPKESYRWYRERIASRELERQTE